MFIIFSKIRHDPYFFYRKCYYLSNDGEMVVKVAAASPVGPVVARVAVGEVAAAVAAMPVVLAGSAVLVVATDLAVQIAATEKGAQVAVATDPAGLVAASLAAVEVAVTVVANFAVGEVAAAATMLAVPIGLAVPARIERERTDSMQMIDSAIQRPLQPRAPRAPCGRCAHDARHRVRLEQQVVPG